MRANIADSWMQLALSTVAVPCFPSFSHCMLRFKCGCGEDWGGDYLGRLAILSR